MFDCSAQLRRTPASNCSCRALQVFGEGVQESRQGPVALPLASSIIALEEFNERVHLSFSQLLEATQDSKRIRVALYDALPHDACKEQIELIRPVKGLLPLVGIIRVRPDGKCRAFLRRKGQKDWDLAQATPTVIKITQNAVK